VRLRAAPKEFPVDAPPAAPFVRRSPHGKLAQLVEQRTENPCVPGSIPGLATTFQHPAAAGSGWKMANNAESAGCDGVFFAHGRRPAPSGLSQLQPEKNTMLKKYTIEYSVRFRKHSPPQHHQYFTDDPVACEEFVQALFENGMGLHGVKHEGVELPKAEFDHIVKVAAAKLASKLICTSLNIKPEEERYRFGFAA
jgi:hypothetical protein